MEKLKENIQEKKLDKPKTTICLVYMFKNEAPRMKRLIDSVHDKIVHCIGIDTGSSDGSAAILHEELKKHGVSCETFHCPFEDFGETRTRTIQMAYKKAEYLLLVDGDFVVVEKDPAWRSIALTEDRYYVDERSENNFYPRILLIKASLISFYVGVTHEYVDTKPTLRNGSRRGRFKGFFIHHIGDGGSKADKFTRDIRMFNTRLPLTKSQFLKCRYTFYRSRCQSTIRLWKEALDGYEERCKMIGGSRDEIYICKVDIGECRRALKEPLLNAIIPWLEGHCYSPSRLEAIHAIIDQCNDQMKPQFWKLACSLGVLAIGKPSHEDETLFLQEALYDYRFFLNLAVACSYCPEYNEVGSTLLDQVVAKAKFPDSVAGRLSDNMKSLKARCKTKSPIRYSVKPTSPFSNQLEISKSGMSTATTLKQAYDMEWTLTRDKCNKEKPPLIDYLGYLIDSIKLGVSLQRYEPLQLLWEKCQDTNPQLFGILTSMLLPRRV